MYSPPFRGSLLDAMLDGASRKFDDEEEEYIPERLRPENVLQRLQDLLETEAEKVNPTMIEDAVQDIRDCLYYLEGRNDDGSWKPAGPFRSVSVDGQAEDGVQGEEPGGDREVAGDGAAEPSDGKPQPGDADYDLPF